MDKLAGHPGGRADKHVQMDEITMDNGADSLGVRSRGGSRRESGQSGVAAYVVRDNMISRRIRCMRELYPCPNLDCISVGIISRWAGGRESCWRRS